MNKCKICKRLMAPKNDHGGDCTWCMAEAGDIYCFYQLLEEFDWHYQMSDDHRVFIQGMAEANKVDAIAEINGWHDLKKSYAAHVFSGPRYGTDKLPKPECPQ